MRNGRKWWFFGPKTCRSAARTPICHIVPISRMYGGGGGEGSGGCLRAIGGGGSFFFVGSEFPPSCKMNDTWRFTHEIWGVAPCDKLFGALGPDTRPENTFCTLLTFCAFWLFWNLCQGGRKWGFKRWGFKQIGGYLRKRPFSSVFWIYQVLFAPSGKGPKRQKKGEKGRFRPISRKGSPVTP